MNFSDPNAFPGMMLRLATAAAIGLVLGIDRDLHKKPAGLRVLSMVSLGSCAITMVSITSMSNLTSSGQVPSANDGVLRTVQGILSGIGFLGAGAIMRLQGKDEVHGMTTAASIWICAILGMICGFGHWMLGLCTFALSWIILVCGSWAEFRILQWSNARKSQQEK
jgi:putative Mg2+ transporter-C (MgtC) family protein